MMTNGEQRLPAPVREPSKTTSEAARNKILPSAESIQSAGALVSVVIGVLAITVLAIATMALIGSGKDATTLVPLSTAAFGVISAVIGAYLGIKIGTDHSKELARGANDAVDKLTALHDKIQATGGDGKPSN